MNKKEYKYEIKIKECLQNINYKSGELKRQINWCSIS